MLAEDIDPSVGRFRNMVQTAVIPIKVSTDHLIQKCLIYLPYFSLQSVTVLSSLVTVPCLSNLINVPVWLTVFSE